MKRLVLFVLTNLAILAMLSLVVRVTGIDSWLAARGMSLASLLVMATLFGFAGSLLSLALSKWMAIRSLGVQRIEQPGSAGEQWLLETVQGLAQRAGVGRPEVGIFPAAQPNAFATGASRDHALVAVSSGLLAAMTREEMESADGVTDTWSTRRLTTIRRANRIARAIKAREEAATQATPDTPSN